MQTTMIFKKVLLTQDSNKRLNKLSEILNQAVTQTHKLLPKPASLQMTKATSEMYESLKRSYRDNENDSTTLQSSSISQKLRSENYLLTAVPNFLAMQRE